MSKNTLLSELINYISANSSGNVVIAAPSSGYALDVTGTGRFTSTLTTNTIVTSNPLAINLNYAGSVNDIQLGAGTPMRIVNQAYNTVLFQVNNSGVISKPMQPLAMGGLASDTSVPATTFTTIGFVTTQGFYGINTNGCWNNSTYGFTAPVTGIYMVNLSIYTNNISQVALHVNGVRKHSIPGTIGTFGGSAMIFLFAGEVLTLQGYASSSGVVYANQYHTWFGIYLM